MSEQAQVQNQAQEKEKDLLTELPDEIVEMFRDEISKKQYRKCVDRDFVEIVSELALSVDDYYDYEIRRIGDWYMIHTWTINGDDFAMVLRVDRDTGEVEECIVIDSAMFRL